MSLHHALGGWQIMACCGGPFGHHAPGCQDALDAMREQAGESRCESCGDWFTGTGECPACVAYEVEEAAWEARQAATAAREGRL